MTPFACLFVWVLVVVCGFAIVVFVVYLKVVLVCGVLLFVGCF